MQQSRNTPRIAFDSTNSKVDKSNEVQVFTEFKQYLRLIDAFNADNFRHADWRSMGQSAVYALCASVFIVSLPTYASLGAWYLIESDADLEMLVVSVPLLLSLLQNALLFIGLVMSNRLVRATIDRLQRVVNQRKRPPFLILITFSHSLYSIRSLVKF